MRTKLETSCLLISNYHYKTMQIKTVWYWHKNRHIDQWSSIAIPEINPGTYGQLIHDKGPNNIQWGKDSLFNKRFWEKLDSHLQNNLTEPLSSTIHKNELKWIKELNLRPETIKLLEVNVGSKLLQSDLGDDNLHLTPKWKATKAKNKQMGLHQAKNLLYSKGTINKMKRSLSKWKKIFANHISHKGLIS